MELNVPKEALLARLESHGLEIGALHSPLPVPEGVRVRYVDLISAEDTRRFYPEATHDHEVVDPDLLRPADRLDRVPNESEHFVIASHLLEHIADPIGALSEWHRVLVSGGRVLLVLPDQRWTFDRHRLRTPLDHLLADHAQDPADPERRERDFAHYLEWGFWVNGLDSPEALRFWARMLESVSYPIHFHCWTPADVEELIEHLAASAGPVFELEELVERPGAHEFALLLRKPGRAD